MGKFSEGKDYKVIAFAIAMFNNDENLELMRRVVSEGKKHHCKVVIFTTLTDIFYDTSQENKEKKIFDAVEPEKYDAIVIMAESFKLPETYMGMVERAKAANVPVIAVDAEIPGCVSIRMEYGDTFRQIVEHMVEDHKFKKINFIAGMRRNSFSDERINVYKEVLKKNNIPVEEDRIYYGDFWADPTVRAMQEMEKTNLKDTEAIICANDIMAITAGNYLVERGYTLPKDMAISGFDGIALEKYCNPRLTTGIYNLEELVSTILKIIDENAPASAYEKTFHIHNRMQIGCSCGCQGQRSRYASFEVVQVKTELDHEIQFYGDMAVLLTNYGNAPELRTAVQAFTFSLNALGYRNFWYCSNDEIKENAIIEAGKVKGTFKNQMHALHYYKDKAANRVVYNQKFKQEDLIPNREKVLDETDNLIVLITYLENEVSGYTVVDCDMETFWFSAYASFVTGFRSMMELQRVYKRMIHLYQDDPLTGLLNRTGFYQRVPAMMEKNPDLDMSIISLDMDHLKMINDTFGHLEGDEALKAIGKIIAQSVENEVAARIGGDEFLIAFTGEDTESRAEEIVEKIKAGLSKYNAKKKKEYLLEASIGAYTNRIRKHTLDHFLKQADDLMYARKYLHRRERGEL